MSLKSWGPPWTYRWLWCMSFFLCFSMATHANEPTDAHKTQSRWVSAITSDNTSVLHQILQHTNVSDLSLLSVTASNGKTALMVACKQGDRALAEALVAQGANIRATTITDGTAFMFAVLGDQKGLAQWLQELGADINAQGSNGWTSVMIAAAKGLDDTLAWLLEAGANAQTPDVYGFTPLMRAVDNNHNDSVRQLLATDSRNIHWQDEVDNTALHYAVSNQNLTNVNQLLAAGANPTITNLSGDTPWSLVNAMNTDSTNDKGQQAVIAQINIELQRAIQTQ